MREMPTLFSCGLCASPTGCPDQVDCWQRVVEDGGQFFDDGNVPKSIYPVRVLQSRDFIPLRNRRAPPHVLES